VGLKIVDVRHLNCTYLLTYTKLARAYETDNICETVEYRAKVTINGLYKVVQLQRLSIAAKMYDLELNDL